MQEYRGALYVPNPPIQPANAPRVVSADRVVQAQEGSSVAAADRAATARSAQLTETLGQCLQQMKALNTRIANLEMKLAASSPAAPPLVVPEPMPARSPANYPPGPIAPAGVFAHPDLPSSGVSNR